MDNLCQAGIFPILPPSAGQDVTSSGSTRLSLTPSVSHPRVQAARLLGSSTSSSLPTASNSSWPPSEGSLFNPSSEANTGAWSAPNTGQFATPFTVTETTDNQFSASAAGNRGSGSSSSSGDSAGADYTNILNNEEGWDLEFVPRRSEKHDCPICLLVLREPMQTECGHRFCRACILKWLRESEARCPVDNQSLEERQLFPDNFAKREILALTVKCPNYTKGCDQLVVLKHLQTHLDSCVFSLMPCPNECANVLLRGRLSEHLLNQCPKRIIKCSLCQIDVVAEKQQGHLVDCPEAIINCPSCELQLKRQQLSQHLSTECKKSPAKCQYHLLGCPYQGERDTLEDHENSNLSYHMGLINLSIIRLFTMLRIDPTSLQSMHRPSSLGYQPTDGVAGSGATSFPSYFMNPKESMNLLQKVFQQLQITPGNSNSLMPSNFSSLTGSDLNVSQSLPTTGSSVESMQSGGINVIYAGPGSVSIATSQNLGVPVSQAQASAQNVLDEEQSDSDKTRYQNMSYTSDPSNRPDNEMPRISVSENQMYSIKYQNDLQDESLARHDQQLVDLSHQRDYQEKVIRDLKTKVKTLESTIHELEGRCGNGIYVWKVKNYLKLRREAEKGELTAIHSTSFYSNYYGYKLCIRVNLNGVDSARGTHLSLFIHFMQGEYDDLLEWPFSGRIILTIIDQNPICEMRNNISETLMSKPNLAAFQRPVSTRNHKGFGYMEFLPLSIIDGSTYVRNDTLMIKANIIPTHS